MESVVATMLAMLEMSFIFVSLGLLHSLRKVIGSAPFYIAIGLLYVFAQFICAAELKVVTGIIGFDFYIGRTVIFLPLLGALMLVYITDGTLATQRMILGALAALGFFLYLGSITLTQCNWTGYSITQGVTADTLSFLISQSKKTMAGATLALAIDIFLLPIFFQRLRNMGGRLFFCVLGAMMFTQLVDTFIYLLITFWDKSNWWVYLNSSFGIKALAIIWITILIVIYLKRIETENPGEERKALDIIFAFFGGYKQARKLERDLEHWEGRFKLVVENAAEMILIVDPDGMISDVNQTAITLFKATSRSQVVGRKFYGDFYDENERLTDKEWFLDIYKNILAVDDYTRKIKLYLVIDGQKIFLDASISTIEYNDLKLMLFIANDISEEINLTREKDTLSEQLAHSQRLEAVGRLAGGVAHDFNNYIHAIIGNLDVIKYFYKVDDPAVNRRIEKIFEISEQAGHLTKQLLGFARKGKYQVKELDLRKLIEDSIELFLPQSHRNLEFTYELKDRPMLISGDAVQLQQVMLNLMLNAMDAMEEKERNNGYMKGNMHMEIIVDDAKAFNISSVDRKGHNFKRDNFYCARIEDNGAGMSKTIQQKIFEPFFTTKPYGKGTGMGLAMAYGTIANHGGRVQVTSKVKKGTTFYILLPKKGFEPKVNYDTGEFILDTASIL
jgi:PAS domain S-box-containing protein